MNNTKVNSKKLLVLECSDTEEEKEYYKVEGYPTLRPWILMEKLLKYMKVQEQLKV